MNGTSDYELFRVKHPSGCQNWFQVTIESLDGNDVDLYMNHSAPEDTLSDTTKYTVAKETSATKETHRWEGVAAGDVFSVLVKHKAADTAYSVTYQKSCGGGGGGGLPPPPKFDRATDPL